MVITIFAISPVVTTKAELREIGTNVNARSDYVSDAELLHIGINKKWPRSKLLPSFLSHSLYAIKTHHALRQKSRTNKEGSKKME